MAYFLGIDSGGTKTECWMGDETQVLGRARAGTVKFTRVSVPDATATMQRLLAETAASAGIPLSQITRTCVGISGYSIAEVREWAAEVVGAEVAGAVDVCGDDEIALDAAFHGGPGILVIGGTGSVVLGRAANGSRFTAGGWGPAIGDEGSGYWIGREALRKVFRAHDEGIATTMAAAICAAWGAQELVDLVGMANARPGPDFAALVPAVVQCAAGGDPLAQRLLAKAGNELGKQVEMVWAKMNAAAQAPQRVAYTGSVVEKIALVQDRFRERLQQNCPNLTVAEAAASATAGALWRARTAAP